MLIKKEIFEDVKNGRYQLAIFGAGRYGKAMFIILMENEIPVHFFIDNSTQHDGKVIIGGIKCTLPRNFNKDVVCVIAVNDIYADTLYKQADTLGFSAVIHASNIEMETLIEEIDDERCIRLLYKGLYGKDINLERPELFTEKLNWLKLYDHKPKYTIFTDKYAVRKHVTDTIGEKYLIPLIGGPWESADEIDFDKLP